MDLVIKAFNKLNLPLVIVGTGREERKLKNISNKNIHFVGFVNEEKLVQYYKNAKALIFPQEEDFGIVAVEAQSFGIPVIAFKRGGAVDIIIENKTGIFFKKQTKKELILAIQKFGSLKFNIGLIKENAKRFSKERFKREFLETIREVC